MIWDTFMFFNELDILEIRLNILYPFVDRFVLVEATTTHANKKKPLFYDQNKDRFTKFNDKIVHIIVKDMPKSADFWIPENFQRNCITRGLTKARPHDLILVSDVDEIPRPSKFHEIHDRGISIFSQDYYIYNLNTRAADEPYWNMGTRSIHYQEMVTPQETRMWHSQRKPIGGAHTIFYGGWHWSYLGGVDMVQTKLVNTPDQQLHGINTDISRLECIRRIQNGLDPLGGRRNSVWQPVPIDETFPDYIRENREKYKHLIVKDPKGRW
jgi:beta-1,4-mannosyl-glycoprotein beta-1,4-N-acetylglucosaminyltransferase